MIAKINLRASTEHPGLLPGHTFKEYKPADWTCYSAGENTPEWIMQAAEDSCTSIDILAMLAESCNLELRIAVADNQSTPTVTMMLLAQDESADLRYQLAENHNIDESVLRLLADDSHPYIAHRAQKTLKRLRLQDGATIFPFPVLAVAPESRRELAIEMQHMLF